MNRPAHLVEPLIDLRFCPLHSFLSEIDCVRQQAAALFKLFSIGALLHLDAFVLEELVHMLIQLIFFNRFHSFYMVPKIPDLAGKGNYRSMAGL